MQLSNGFDEYRLNRTPEDELYVYSGHLTAYESIAQAGTIDMLAGGQASWPDQHHQFCNV